MTNRGSVVWDWGLAGGVAVIQLAIGWVLDLRQPGADPLDALGTALLIAGPVALVLRRFHPLPVMYTVFAVAIAYPLLGHHYLPALAAPAAAFLSATAAPRAQTYPAVPVAYLLMVWPLPWLLGREPDGWQALGALGWAVALVGAAEMLRLRRALDRTVQQRDDAAAFESIAARERESAAERLALAEELHGVVVHSLSTINKQSALALDLSDRKPQQAVTALAAVKTTSRAALEDAQALLHTLRTTGARPEDPEEPDAEHRHDDRLLGGLRTAGFLGRPPRERRQEPAEPQRPKPAPKPDEPSLDDLDGLVQRARAAGVAVTYRVLGTATPLPAAIDAVGARIVQESLRNVQQHAPGAEATVTLRYAADSIDITVDNARPVTPPARTQGARTGGDGIIGMRERAHELGGALTAGPRPSGGFRVAARLPSQARLAAVPGPEKPAEN